MSKKILNTEKLYYGFPIFILGYKDEKFGYNFSTASSSYSLDNQLVVGISNKSNAAKQIEKHGCFTLNIPNDKYLEQIKIGGFNSGVDKFNLQNSFHFKPSEIIEAPIISECSISLECTLSQIINVGEINHVFSSIDRWLVEENLLNKDQFVSKQLNPILYMGDSNKRTFRYLEKISD